MMDPVLVANARVGETLSAFDLLEAGKVRADMAFNPASAARFAEARDPTVGRLIQAGVVPTTALQVASEWMAKTHYTGMRAQLSQLISRSLPWFSRYLPGPRPDTGCYSARLANACQASPSSARAGLVVCR